MRTKAFLPLQLLLIFGLALVSGYQIPDLSDSSWDTVLFLSPYGIVRNLSDDTSVLRTFYWDISSGQVELSATQVGLMTLLYCALAVNSALFIKRARARK